MNCTKEVAGGKDDQTPGETDTINGERLVCGKMKQEREKKRGRGEKSVEKLLFLSLEEQKGDWENNLNVLRKLLHSKKSGKVHCCLGIGKGKLERTENHRALCRRQGAGGLRIWAVRNIFMFGLFFSLKN